jgi:aryl-alcohol dehydrogenase-like predicted oxidoreductase
MDIFCLHRDNLDIPIDEFVSALNDVVDEGLVNLIGASNWTLSRFAAARDYAAESNMTPFTVISNNFSLAAMVDPVWPGCVGMDSEFLNYVNNEGLILFPWSSQARGFFIPKKSSVLDHFSNPTMEEEKRVWHSEDNILRRDRCFKIAKNKGIEPIEVALAYVLSTSPNIIPLIGPRNVFETNSSIKASKIILSQDELEFLEGN